MAIPCNVVHGQPQKLNIGLLRSDRGQRWPAVWCAGIELTSHALFPVFHSTPEHSAVTVHSCLHSANVTMLLNTVIVNVPMSLLAPRQHPCPTCENNPWAAAGQTSETDATDGYADLTAFGVHERFPRQSREANASDSSAWHWPTDAGVAAPHTSSLAAEP
jgi:hypothetical protein